MNAFVYFIPSLTRHVTRDDFTAVGLGHALTVGNPTSRAAQAGPMGLGGFLASPTGKFEAPALFEPDKQVWQAGPGKKFFVGYYTDARPGPAALERERVIPGEAVRLGDENLWTVPIAVSFAGGRGSTLPRRFIIGDDGETWGMEVEPKYLHLCQHAEAVAEAWLAGEETADGAVQVSLPLTESLGWCVNALACNYRVSAAEVSLLGLLNTDSRWEILKAMIDACAMERVDAMGQKKTEPPDTSAT